MRSGMRQALFPRTSLGEDLGHTTTAHTVVPIIDPVSEGLQRLQETTPVALAIIGVSHIQDLDRLGADPPLTPRLPSSRKTLRQSGLALIYSSRDQLTTSPFREVVVPGGATSPMNTLPAPPDLSRSVLPHAPSFRTSSAPDASLP